MKRRDFFRTLFGAAAAVAVGPKVLELAAEVLPAPAKELAWESGFIIPSQEIIDSLVMRTVWYWNDLTLKNLKEGVRGQYCIND